MASASFRDLVAWQKAMALARGAFALARTIRLGRYPGLAMQLERAATSVPSNIAEGHGRRSPRDYARFLAIATGSLREVETLVALAGDIGVAKHETVTELLKLADETARVVFGLKRSLERQARAPTAEPVC